MSRLLLTLIALVLLTSTTLKLAAGLPDYKVGGDLYAAFVHNDPWKHYGFLTVEAGLGLWLLTGWKRKWSAQAALFLLASLTALLLSEFFLSGAPRVCGCFANLIASRREEAGKALMWSTIRNSAMIVALAWSLWQMMKPAPQDSPASSATFTT